MFSCQNMLKVILLCFTWFAIHNNCIFADNNVVASLASQEEKANIEQDKSSVEARYDDVDVDNIDEAGKKNKQDNVQKDVENQNKQNKKNNFKNNKKNSSKTSFKLAPTAYYNAVSGNLDVGVAFLWHFTVSDDVWLIAGLDCKYYNIYKIKKHWVKASSYAHGEFGRYRNIADIIAVIGARAKFLQDGIFGLHFGLGVGVIKMRLYNIAYGGGVNGIFASFRMRIGLEFGYKRFYIKPEFSIVDYSRSYVDDSGHKRHYSTRYYTDSYGRRRQSSRCGGEFSVGIGMYLF